MSKIYDALNEVGANPFDPNSAAPSEHLGGGSTGGLSKELVEFEKLLSERFGRLRQAAGEVEKTAASESQQAAATIEKLKSQIIALDSRLKETKELLESKNLANQVRERDMAAKVNELKGELNKKDEILLSRVADVNALKSEVDRLRDGIRGMVSMFNQQAQALGGHAAENHRIAGFPEPAIATAQNSASSLVANPSGRFVESATAPSETIDRSTLER